jgi:hypothetical protein
VSFEEITEGREAEPDSEEQGPESGCCGGPAERTDAEERTTSR